MPHVDFLIAMPTKAPLFLGIDVSTQSMSGVVLDSASGEQVWSRSLAYRDDPRLQGFGFEHDSVLIPPREPGEAEQPPRLFIAALEALLSDLKAAGVDLSALAAINTSAQQHAHLYLNPAAENALASLRHSGNARYDLLQLLSGCCAYGGVPIWKTANTTGEAAHIRAHVGGAARMIALTGSDIPLRFSANVIRKVAIRYPEAYAATWKVMQLSSLIPAMLAGDGSIPVDFGNACGSGLMNYEQRQWDRALLGAVAGDLPGGEAALAGKLPRIDHPLSVCGSIAAYFQVKYGIPSECKIVIGSGDNPQSKVLARGDLLSLGTSFVYMRASPEDYVDTSGASNAMYDGLGRPFKFFCRTNGALAWDRLRTRHRVDVKDYAASEAALARGVPGVGLRFWHPDAESFPSVGACADLVRVDQGPIDFGSDYSAVVDSTLGLIYRYSRNSGGQNDAAYQEALSVCGGPSASPGVMRRIAALWRRPIRQAGQAGAALGAAFSAVLALAPAAERSDVGERLRQAIYRGAPIEPPDTDLIEAYHAPGAYLDRLESAFESLRSGRQDRPGV